MTQFINKSGEERLSIRKTRFKKFVATHYEIFESSCDPSDFEVVEYIGWDSDYGDVFKATKKGRFTIYFGEKGDEFND